MGETIHYQENEINEALEGLDEPTVEIIKPPIEEDLANPPEEKITQEDVDNVLEKAGITPIADGHVVVQDSKSYEDGEHNN